MERIRLRIGSPSAEEEGDQVAHRSHSRSLEVVLVVDRSRRRATAGSGVRLDLGIPS